MVVKMTTAGTDHVVWSVPAVVILTTIYIGTFNFSDISEWEGGQGGGGLEPPSTRTLWLFRMQNIMESMLCLYIFFNFSRFPPPRESRFPYTHPPPLFSWVLGSPHSLVTHLFWHSRRRTWWNSFDHSVTSVTSRFFLNELTSQRI